MEMTDDKQTITPADLKQRQYRVVIYRRPNGSVIVPALNMRGDLSKLPEKLQEHLRHCSKNGFLKNQSVVDPSTPFGKKVLSDIKGEGLFCGYREGGILGRV